MNYVQNMKLKNVYLNQFFNFVESERNSNKSNLFTNFDKFIDFYKKGNKIKIKKKNVGSFTRYCGGNVTEECIRKGKNSPSVAIRKKATFADNSRRWKHKEGGTIYGI